MVSRLVEEEQARLGSEGLGEETATLQPAGKVVKGPIFGQAEAGNQVIDPKVFFPVLRVVIVPEARGHDIADVTGEAFRDFLGQAGDADIIGNCDRPGIGGGLAGSDTHQGGLAGAVTAQKTDPFAFLNLEVQVV